MIVLIGYDIPEKEWGEFWAQDLERRHGEEILQAIVDGCASGRFEWVKVISLEDKRELGSVSGFVEGLALAKMPKDDLFDAEKEDE